MNLTQIEIEYLKKLIGAAVSRGVNPNAPEWDIGAIRNREELEIINRIYAKLVGDDENDNEL